MINLEKLVGLYSNIDLKKLAGLLSEKGHLEAVLFNWSWFIEKKLNGKIGVPYFDDHLKAFQFCIDHPSTKGAIGIEPTEYRLYFSKTFLSHQRFVEAMKNNCVISKDLIIKANLVSYELSEYFSVLDDLIIDEIMKSK